MANGSPRHAVDKTVKIWDLATGQCETLTGHSRLGPSLLPGRPIGQRLASASDDDDRQRSGIRLRANARRLSATSGRSSLSLGRPDGQRLASASIDRTVKIWDPATASAEQRSKSILNIFILIHRTRLSTDTVVFHLSNPPSVNVVRLTRDSERFTSSVGIWL